MVMYIIASKLNSTFGTIGNAMANKMTAKVVEKLYPFALVWRIKLNTWSYREACLQNVAHFLFLNTFLCLDLNENLLLLNLLSPLFYLVPCIWEF